MLGTGCGKTTIRRSSTPCELANTGGSTKLVASAKFELHKRAATTAAGRNDGRPAYRSFKKLNGMVSLMRCWAGRPYGGGQKQSHRRARAESLDAPVTCYEQHGRFRSAAVRRCSRNRSASAEIPQAFAKSWGQPLRHAS